MNVGSKIEITKISLENCRFILRRMYRCHEFHRIFSELPRNGTYCNATLIHWNRQLILVS